MTIKELSDDNRALTKQVGELELDVSRLNELLQEFNSYDLEQVAEIKRLRRKKK